MTVSAEPHAADERQITVMDRRRGALPVVSAVIAGSAATVAGFAVPWTGRPALDGFLMILGSGAIGLALTSFVRRTIDDDSWTWSAGFEAFVDACLIGMAYYAAYRVRFGNGEVLGTNFPSFVRSWPIVVASQMLALWFAGVYTRKARRSSREAMVALGTAVAAQQAVLQLGILLFWSQTRPYSRGSLLIGAVLALGLLAGWRATVSAIAAAPSWWRRANDSWRVGAGLAAACALTGIAWAVIVPPFEAPDELFFCRVAMDVAETRQAPVYDPLFFRVTQPLLGVMFNAGMRFDAVRNPAFIFVSNQPGRVTMFKPGPRLGVSTRELAMLYVMRAFVLAISIATMLLIYVTALAFFGRPGVAAMVAGLGFLLPQFSFAGSKVNPESLSTLWGAATAALLIGRVTGVLTTRVAWLLLIPLIVTAPFTDSAAVFLVPFAPLAMALAERGWKRRATVLAAVVGVGLAVLAAASAFASDLPGVPRSVQLLLARMDISALSSLDPLAPFLRRPDTGAYLLYEFVPKMFFGFLGWLGQPSILLPASFFAAAFVVLIAALTGLALYGYRSIRDPGDPTVGIGKEPRLFLGIAAIGFFAMLIPIVYSTVLFNRDEWYGRWLFPWLAPLMILLVVGVRECVRAARTRPHVLAAAFGLMAALAAVVWSGNAGAAVTAGVRANHYGDQDHLLRTIRYSIAGLALMPVVIELVAFLARRRNERARVRRREAGPAIVLCSAWAINLVLLFAFVRPLYRPMTGLESVGLIRAELDRGHLVTAEVIAAGAVADLPESDDVAHLVLDMVAETGNYRLLAAYATSRRLATGIPNALEALMMARGIRAATGPAQQQLLEAARGLVPDAASDEQQILALEASRESSIDGRAAALPPGQTYKLGVERQGVRLEAFSMRSWPDGRRVAIVYFRPLVEWNGRRLWLHAYPAGAPSYIDVRAVPVEFDGWHKGELAWEAFPLPGSGRLNVYVGVSLGDDLGDAAPLGSL